MRFELQKSRCQDWYLIAVYVFAVVCVWITFSGCLRGAALLIIPCLLFYALQKKLDICAIEQEDKLQWRLHDEKGGSVSVQLLPSSVLWRYVLILRFSVRMSTARKAVVIFFDSVSPETYRALRRQVKVGYL